MKQHIKIHTRLVNPVADKVLKAVKKLVATNNRAASKITPQWMNVEFYLNGRERGYYLEFMKSGSIHTRCVSFAEHRSSDNIVVHYGIPSEFEENGQLTEAAWNNDQMVHFKFDEADKAALMIYQYLVHGKEREAQVRESRLAAWNFQILS